MTLAASPAALARLVAATPFNRYYRFRIVRLDDGECALEVPFRKAFEREGGRVSGPVFMAAADAAMWLAVVTRVGLRQRWVTTAMTTAFLRGARAEPFTCTARLVRSGRTLIYGVADCVRADGALLTHHTLTYARARDEGARPARRRPEPARIRPGRGPSPRKGSRSGI